MNGLLNPESAIGIVLLGVLTHVINTLLSRQLGLRKRKTAPWVILGVVTVTLIAIQALSLGVEPELFRVNVSVFADGSRKLGEVRVASSVGGEVRMRTGGWEIAIPKSILPADRTIAVTAEADTFDRGSVTLKLLNDPQPSVTIRLHPQFATLRGIVQDAQARAIGGARVFVIGYADDGVLTDQDGSFTVPTKAVSGEQVRVRAHREGFEPVDRYQLLSELPMTIRLERLTQ